MKARPGKVQAKKMDEYTYRNVFEAKVLAQFAGMAGTMEEIKSDEGKAKIEAAHKEEEEALGYTLEQAEGAEENERIFKELQYSKHEPTGQEALACCEPEDIL